MTDHADAAVPTRPPWLDGAAAASPSDTSGVAEALRAAARDGGTVAPRGNGTKLDWGNLPRSCDIVLDTGGLTGIDHAAGDLVVEVGAGTDLGELRRHLARHDQRLTADPPVPGSTVGGMVATGLSGPTRLEHGGVRDLIIGMTVVRSDGVIARSGGRVVKNVAGFDLGKLHTGAYGTLGVITSVTFRLHPLPEASRTIQAMTSDSGAAAEWLRRVRDSQAVPSALEVEAGTGDGELAVQVLIEGAAGGVDRRAAEIAALLDGADVGINLPPGWGRLPGQPDDTLVKIAVPVAETLTAVASLRRLCAAADVSAHLRGSAGAGVLHAAIAASTAPDAAAEVVRGLRTELAGVGGTAVVPRPAAPVRETGLDLWGEVPGLALMRSIKDQLDPAHRLSPGRFAGGI